MEKYGQNLGRRFDGKIPGKYPSLFDIESKCPDAPLHCWDTAEIKI